MGDDRDEPSAIHSNLERRLRIFEGLSEIATYHQHRDPYGSKKSVTQERFSDLNI